MSINSTHVKNTRHMLLTNFSFKKYKKSVFQQKIQQNMLEIQKISAKNFSFKNKIKNCVKKVVLKNISVKH